jgi:hypothetical protein
MFSSSLGSRRADERRRTAASASKKGNRRDRLETGWRSQTPQERRAGARPLNRPETRSGKKRTFFPAVGAFRLVWPRLSAYEPRTRDELFRIPPMSRRAAERRRLKKGGQKRSGATKGASPSLAFKPENTEAEKMSPPCPPLRSESHLK